MDGWAPGIAGRCKDGSAERGSGQERLVYRALAGACWLQDYAAHASDCGIHHGDFRLVQRRDGEKVDEAAAKELPAGGYVVLPAGMAHYAWSTGEAVIQISSMGPFQIKYVNPADDPRNEKKQ